MHATIIVRFELGLDNDKTLSFTTLAKFITDQDIDPQSLKPWFKP